MPVMEEPLQRIPMSYADWLALPARPKAEWVDGVAVVSPQSNRRHQRTCRLLANLLEGALTPLLADTECNLRLPSNRVRIPDVVVTEAMGDLFIEEIPVLVAEVLSPSTRREDTMRKAPEYAAAGIEQYWIIDPEAGSLDIYANADGAWEPIAVLDELHSIATVEVGEHGAVEVDLATILAG